MQQRQDSIVKPSLLSIASVTLSEPFAQPQWLMRFREPENVPLHRLTIDSNANQELCANPLLFVNQPILQGAKIVGVVVENCLFQNPQIQILIHRLQQVTPSLSVINDSPDLGDDKWYHFIQAAGVLIEFDECISAGVSVKKMRDFHSGYKMLFLAYSQPLYRQLGPLIAQLKADDTLLVSLQFYRIKLEELLCHPPSRENHTNALMHLQGYFRKKVSSVQRAKLTQAIHAYHAGIIPLTSVILIIRGLVKITQQPWLQQQRYLFPRLALRIFEPNLNSGEV